MNPPTGSICREKRRLPALLLLLPAIFTGACSREVAVTDRFPTPVMEKLPFYVRLDISPALRTHVHSRKLPSGEEWRVDLGPAQTKLFQQLFSGMFLSVALDGQPHSNGNVAAVFQPIFSRYQFSTPNESKTDYYEAWIQYRMRVYSPDSTLIAEWPFTGYGRSPRSRLGARDSLNLATQRALRDAAALVVLDLERQPAIRALLYGPAGGTAGGGPTDG